MKIGILTFHCAHNYGAVLQTYALQSYLKGIGCDVEVIDYRPEYLTKPYGFSLYLSRPYKNPLRRFISRSIYIANYLKVLFPRYLRWSRFTNFIQNRLILSSERNVTIEQISKYDLYVLGSDQIWNTNITRVLDPVYFGCFNLSEKSNIISYAASCPKYDYDDEVVEKIEKCLSRFLLVSVRETPLMEFLRNKTTIDARLVLDPTLLVQNIVFKSISRSIAKGRRYLLVYSLGLEKETARLAAVISKVLNLEIVKVLDHEKTVYKKNLYHTSSPETFLGLIENAEFVLTSSYHGTTLAISYQKQFLSIANLIAISRFSSLFSILNIQERLVSDCDDIGKITRLCDEKIDYNEVNCHLDKYRESSTSFLQTAIEKSRSNE